MATFVLGVDVGGTNTDAAIVSYPSRDVVKSCKVPTTKDFSTGILHAIQRVLHGEEMGICSLMLGTTTFLNAVLQCSSDLNRVVVMRLCGPTSIGYPPMLNFPLNLKEAIKEEFFLLPGGFEFDGKLISDVDEAMVRDVATSLVEKHTGKPEFLSVVISGIFSPIYPQQEDRVEAVMREVFKEMEFGRFFITKSHDIAQLGFLEREGAAIVNAALRPLAQDTIESLRSKLLDINLPCDVYLTQNDGTLISCEDAMKLPIFTFNSGPTNSLRGAYQLSGIRNAIVADIGGTSTDISVLNNGFPRPASSYVNVAGVRTNFRMPDTVSVGLGGGSLVKFEGGACQVGPRSVGYKISREAKCFGGDVLVATDVAVAKGFAEIDGADKSKIGLPQEKADQAHERIVGILAGLVDKMKVTKDPVPLILVGGGSALIPLSTEIPGISELIKPPHFDVANAVGATIAQVSSAAEDVIDFAKEGYQAALDALKKRARDQVRAIGAVESTVEVVTDSTHLAYMPGRAMQVTCRAVGDLDLSKSKPCSAKDLKPLSTEVDVEPFREDATLKQHRDVDFELPTPRLVVNNSRKEWLLTENDLHCMAIGAGILGTGGGGSPYIGTLETLQQLRAGKTIRVIDIASIDQNEYIVGIGYYGAPLIMTEKLGGAFKHAKASKTLEWLKSNTDPNMTLGALIPVEIGGCNSMAPLFVGAERDLPVLDCDLMGRAFPEYAMVTPLLYGEDPTPAVLRDEKGTELILSAVHMNSGTLAEAFFRNAVVQMGCDGGLAGPALSREVVHRLGIKNSLSQIWNLGRDIIQARQEKRDPLVVIEQTQGGKRVFTGKITEVIRVTEGGYNRGSMVIEGFDSFSKCFLHIEFQNENLIAKLEKQDQEMEIIATVPDLISLVDVDTYQPILTEDLRYGLRVSVLVMPAHPLLTSEEALRIVGPEAFGYGGVNYKPWGTYQTPFSVFY